MGKILPSGLLRGSGMGSAVPESPSNAWLQETDGNFFETFTALAWKQENMRLQTTREDELQCDKNPPTESELGIVVSPYKIGRKEWEELYIAVLYTIKHKLGANSSGYSVYAEDLYEYAQEAFCMPMGDHRRLLAVAQDEKPPILVLNVVVKEAQGLEAKDPNGFSDPYCMLGIQPGNLFERRNSSDDESGGIRGSPRRQGGLKKLGASLKRKDRLRSNSIIMDTLPAKFIRTTSVKPQTLNPRWNERFRLDIEDIRSDMLHLDIWDHDDESSVFDAARKLNEVSSLKGLGRYFKQIAQSARTSTGENIDDFLGCVNVRLEDIPSAGLDRWFCLEGRTERSSVQGQIRLKINLSTREDKDVATEEDNWKEVVEHQELVWVFVEHELNQHLGPSYEWAGDLPQPALTILHQHAIQGDITDLQQTLCRWIMYSRKHMEVPLDYALLFQLLDDLNKAWGDQENPLSRDEEAALAESFNIFLDYCMRLLQKHRELFPPGNKQAEQKLVHMLKCLELIHKLRAFKRCCPFRHELHVDLTNALKKGTVEWYNKMHVQNDSSRKPHKCAISSLIDMVNELNTDIYKGLVYYNEEFESTTGVAYSVVVYKQLEKMVNEMMGCRVQETCNRPNVTADYNNPSTDYMSVGTATFELYMALQEFVRFRENIPSEEKKNLSMVNYHLWFSEAVHYWFVVAKVKAMVRIKKAVEIDKVAFMDNYVKHSTSAVDTATCFVQIKEFWRQLAWPDASGSYAYVLKVIEIICEGTVYYSKLCQTKLQKMAEVKEQEQQKDVSEQLSITVNNMEYVLQTLRPLEEELGVEQIIKALNLNQGSCTANQCRETVYDLLNKAEDEVTAKIFAIICGMVDKLRPDMKKFVFHLAWAPEKLDAESAIRPLLENLDTTLRGLYNNLLQANFDRLLDMIWTVLMHELTETAQTNIGKERMAFFDRLFSSLAILVDFFHGDGKGLPLDCIQNAPYQDLYHLLKLQKAETLHLIELYILQRLEEQPKQENAAFGCLTVKTSYNPTAESLYIDILNARELIPLDPTGFSDPFVIIELVPRHFFPMSGKQKTKVQKKTLYPLFDEAFEFRIGSELCHREGAGLCFSVMDHDMVTKNDFEGEAFISLCNVAGVDGEEIRDLRPTDLLLTHPNDKDEILLALGARIWDKDAQDFIKNLKNRR